MRPFFTFNLSYVFWAELGDPIIGADYVGPLLTSDLASLVEFVTEILSLR